MVLHIYILFSILSIHDLQEEVDSVRTGLPEHKKLFQFTTSKRRSTRSGGRAAGVGFLSIHDLQEEVDFPVYSIRRERLTLSIHDLQEEVD